MKQAENTAACGCGEGSARALQLAGRIIAKPEALDSHEGLLTQIAEAFDASGAGLAAGPNWQPLWRHVTPGRSNTKVEAAWPWSLPQTAAELRNSRVARSYAIGERFGVLAAWGQHETADGWILWVERDSPRPWEGWTPEALGVVAACMARAASAEPGAPSWAAQLECLARRQRLDEIAQVVRKLAHDFGNVLTSILGFAELSRALVPAGSPVQRYQAELHKAATAGASWTQQLQQFARNDTAPGGSANVSQLLRDMYALPQPTGKHLSFDWSVPANLPRVAIDTDSLSLVMHALLHNAAEASGREGTIRTTAQARELGAASCLDYLGRLNPGRVVELSVQDSGEGIGDGVRRRLFRDLFLTTRARKRGMGLAIAYGLVAAHNGGIKLETHTHGGTTVRIVLPVSPEGDSCGQCNR